MPRGRGMRNTEIPAELHSALQHAANSSAVPLATLHAELLTQALCARGLWSTHTPTPSGHVVRRRACDQLAAPATDEVVALLTTLTELVPEPGARTHLTALLPRLLATRTLLRTGRIAVGQEAARGLDRDVQPFITRTLGSTDLTALLYELWEHAIWCHDARFRSVYTQALKALHHSPATGVCSKRG